MAAVLAGGPATYYANFPRPGERRQELKRMAGDDLELRRRRC